MCLIKSKQKADKLQQYIGFTKEEVALIGQLATKRDEDGLTKLNELRNKIGQLIEELSGL